MMGKGAGLSGSKGNEVDDVNNTDGGERESHQEVEQDGKIRVAIPDREVNDQSMAVTE